MRPMMERLEHRWLQDGAAAEVAAEPAAVPDVVPPTLQSVRVLGPWQSATGLALAFSEPLDPATTTDVASFRVWGTIRERASGPLETRKLPLARADYDDATRTVTLVPARPGFNVRRYLRTVFVRETVTDAAGNGLAGDRDPLGNDRGGILDGYVPFLFRQPRTKRSFFYQDANRSLVRLRLRGPGRATILVRAEGARLGEAEGWWGRSPVETWGEGVQLFIDGATPRTVLTGSVTPGPNGGDARTSFVEIINPGGAQLTLLNDPAFSIGSVRA